MISIENSLTVENIKYQYDVFLSINADMKVKQTEDFSKMLVRNAIGEFMLNQAIPYLLGQLECMKQPIIAAICAGQRMRDADSMEEFRKAAEDWDTAVKGEG